MSEQLVPADILHASREAVIHGSEPYDAKTIDRIRAGRHDYWPMVKVAAYAILAERNRVHKALKGED